MTGGKGEIGAPLWVLTFADLMNLLLTFFILLVSMSSIRKEETEFKQATQSIQNAFENGGNLLPWQQPMTDMQKIEVEAIKQLRQGDAEDAGQEGTHNEVRNVRDGLALCVGGTAAFATGRAELLPTAQQDLITIANIIRGYNNKVEIRGHTSKAQLPADSPCHDHMELSCARARTVYGFLVKQGIDAQRLRVTGAGNTEPLQDRAYEPAEWARNDRVEIVVLESLADEFEGSHVAARAAEQATGRQ